MTDDQGTRRNRIYILYHLIIRGRRRIMLISFGGLLASRKCLEFCCFARVCIILYSMYRVSALLSIIRVSYSALHVVTLSTLRSTQTFNPDVQPRHAIFRDMVLECSSCWAVERIHNDQD
jgi:hypothetical protein